ncbi:MAG: hypothetical protein FJZ10_02910 [Candidatus Omnitrophica bacterium]|nr:hypothetical protein [Candidatus Omnitrophota bacterium]
MLSKLKKLFKAKKTAKKTKRTTPKLPAKKTKAKITKTKAIAKTKIKKASSEELVGAITHYFPHVKAGVIKIKKGVISVNDSLHIKGHTTDFIQKVNSLQIDRKPVESAAKGKEIGLLVKSRVRHNDKVYKLK